MTIEKIKNHIKNHQRFTAKRCDIDTAMYEACKEDWEICDETEMLTSYYDGYNDDDILTCAYDEDDKEWYLDNAIEKIELKDAFNNIGRPDLADTDFNALTEAELKATLKTHNEFLKRYGDSYKNSRTFKTLRRLFKVLNIG